MSSHRLVTRHLAVSLIFIAGYLLLGQPQIILFSRFGAVAWYPAIGLAMGLLLGIDPRYVLLVAPVDAFAGWLNYHQPIWSWSETIGSIAVACCYGAASYLLRRQLRIDLTLRRGGDVGRYVLVTMSAAVVATGIGVGCLILDGSIRWADVTSAAPLWFVGDAIGLIGFTPFLLIFVLPRARAWLNAESSESRVTKKRPKDATLVINLARSLEIFAQVLSTLLVIWVMFSPRWRGLEPLYLSFMPVLWMAIRGIRRVAAGILVLDFGIVVGMLLYPPESVMQTKIGLLMLVVSGAGLFVGACVTESKCLSIALRERTTYLGLLFDNSPIGIAVLRRDGSVDLVNESFRKITQYESEDLVGKNLDSVFEAEKLSTSEAAWSTRVLSGETIHQSSRRKRKDGLVVDVALKAVPLSGESGIEGAYVLCEDVSEQIRASKAEHEHAAAQQQLVEELELRTFQMAELNEMGSLLASCASVQEAFTIVANCTQRLFPAASSGSLYTFRASRNLLELATTWGSGESIEQIFSPESCWSLRRGKPQWSNAAQNGVQCAHFSSSPGEHLCLPLVGQGETLGIVHLHFSEAPGSSEAVRGPRERLGINVAAQIALALANLKLRDTLRDQSIRDPLTGLFNRRFMHESLEREMMRSRRKDRPLAVISIDIDHFKSFNDTHGHEAGDRVLQSTADLLQRSFRADDIVCRCGGEEFTVILPESSLADAFRRAENVRADMKGLQVRYRENLLGQVSISLGIAAFPEHGANAEELLRVADECLYQSKAQGRDRVTAPATKARQSTLPAQEAE